MLHVEGLGKCFFDPGRGEVRALDGVSFTAESGVVALVGANGAGKSTLLRCIATLLNADRGRVLVGGHDAALEPLAVRRRLGFLSAGTRLYQRLTVREMLAYAAGFFGLDAPARDEAIARVAATFELGRLIDQRCDGLSTGQAQRVNIARTLLADPDLLVLDEPTTGLDIVSARILVEAVLAARRPGRLILIATHIMAEVDALADRLLILDRGRLVFDGAPGDLGRGEGLSTAVQALIRPAGACP